MRKFEGVEGADYLVDLPVPKPEVPVAGGDGCCGGTASAELKPLAWTEVWKHLAQAMEDWKKAGFALSSPEAYLERIRICKSCPRNQYQWFQCKQCRCIVFTKAKLATERCPYDLWPKWL